MSQADRKLAKEQGDFHDKMKKSLVNLKKDHGKNRLQMLQTELELMDRENKKKQATRGDSSIEFSVDKEMKNRKLQAAFLK